MNKTRRLAQIISVGPAAPYGHRFQVQLYAEQWTWPGGTASFIPPHEERMFRISRRAKDALQLKTNDVVSIVINGITVTDVKFINYDAMGSAIINWYGIKLKKMGLTADN